MSHILGAKDLSQYISVDAKIDLIAILFNHELPNQPSGRSTDGLRNGW